MSEEGERGVYLALVGTGAVALGLIWLTGALAGALFGSGLVSVPAGQLVAVALALPSHLGDPRRAWPDPARSGLPGPAGIYVAMTLAIACLGGLGLGLLRAVRNLELPSPWRRREKVPAARWASRRDLAPLRVPAPQPGRLTLGRSRGALLAAEERQSVIVIGPTQTHKTSGLAIPALLEWEGPVLCTSVKSDLLAHTVSRRESLGEVWVFDPAQVTALERSRATPLRGAGDWEGALRVAHWLAGAAKSGARDLSDADFWFSNAEKLIAPLLFAAASSGRTMESVVTWLDEGPEVSESTVKALLEKTKVAASKRAYMATQNREERQRSSVYTTAETILSAFADPRVAEETAYPDYTPADLLAGKNTLYLVAPTREQERLRTVFSALIQELLSVVEGRAAQHGEPISPALLVLLDECANIAPFPGLDETASTAAGLGVQLVTIFQDLAQMQARFGRRAPTIFNNHGAKVVGNGISDVETLTYLSRLIGVGEFGQRSISTSRGERGRRSQTEGDTYRELAPGHLVRQRRAGSAILVYRNLPAAMIELRPWFEEEGLRRLQRDEEVRLGGEQ
jgi:type IV secretion system protein VirD4